MLVTIVFTQAIDGPNLNILRHIAIAPDKICVFTILDLSEFL
jgi:hypothetical protein